MQRMPNIKLTPEEYQIMTTYCHYGTGGEGIICRSQRPDTLYKIFVDYETVTPTGLPDNKYKKILELYERRLKGSVHPLSTVSLNDELIGYEMTFDEDDMTLDKIFLFRGSLIKALQDTSEILKYFASEDITYGDVKANNILINRRTHEAKFCDMDNVRMGDYPIDLLSYHVDSFITTEADINATVDAYMHNLMTLQYLNDPTASYNKILSNIKEGKYKRAYKKEARPTLASMPIPEQFTGEYLAPYVKKLRL